MTENTIEKKNKVFIATSLDGFIADKNGNTDWLHTIPNPNNDDMGYLNFMNGIDALIMGRNTFETVCGFDIPWPYQKPVYVLSDSLTKLPGEYMGKAILIKGPLKHIMEKMHHKGYYNIYMDGGKTIQSFLKEDLIDEMTITIIPYVLGGGISLFSELPAKLNFKCVESKIYLDQIVQNRFVRTR